MKHHILTTLLIISCYAVSLAQATQKGNLLIGTTTEILGSAVNNTSSTGSIAIISGQVNNSGNSFDLQRTTSFNINPNVAYFLIDGLAIGGELSFGYAKSENDDDPETLIDVGPIVRYYIDLGNIKPFVQTNFSLGRARSGNDDTDKNNLVEFGLSAGAAFFFNDHVSIDLLMGYRHDRSISVANTDNYIAINSFGLGIGFSFFID